MEMGKKEYKRRKFVCINCGKEEAVETFNFRCGCGGPFKLEHDLRYSEKRINRDVYGMWRYGPFIPVKQKPEVISLGEGMTPIVQVANEKVDLNFKLEFLSPTGSFKDRGASVLFSFLKELGIKSCVEDSSGNAASAAAAYSARAGIDCEIYCPDYTSAGKLIQVLAYGSKLNRIRGTRNDTSIAVEIAAGNSYYASHNWNPFFIEGTKTIAYEIVEQTKMKLFDNIIIPLGYGGLFRGIGSAFIEMYQSGAIRKIPKLFGVQSEQCCPLYDAFHQKRNIDNNYVQPGPTLAEGICGTRPVASTEILEMIKLSGGSITTVKEHEIESGMNYLSSKGLFVEPTSAVVASAVRKFILSGEILSGETVLAILTGTGLKAADKYEKTLKRSI